MYFKIRIEYGVCVLIFSWVLALYSAIYGISAQKEVQQLQQSLDLAQSLVIFGAIKNRRIYVFHEEPLMDEDYTAARALKIRIPLLFKMPRFCP